MTDVTELDWWDAVRVDVDAVWLVDLTWILTQHLSGRTPFNIGRAL